MREDSGNVCHIAREVGTLLGVCGIGLSGCLLLMTFLNRLLVIRSLAQISQRACIYCTVWRYRDRKELS